MQLLNAAPRDTMTVAQVKTLLTGPLISVAAGAERLDQNLNVVEDISNDLGAAQVTWDEAADVHRDCTVQLSRTLNWSSDLLRLYVTLADASGITARFNVGVFVLTTPRQPVAQAPTTYSVQGYDRLYLLNRPPGDSVSFTAGTGVIAAVNTCITAAGLTGALIDTTATAKTLPADMVWPLIPTDGTTAAPTWLSIINQLLATIGYDNLWCDENGYFRSEPFLDPAVRAYDETFNVDNLTQNIVAEDRTLTVDQWNLPNKWIFTQQNRATAAAAPTEGDGIYTVDRSAGLLAWVKQTALDAADQASLVTQGNATVAADTSSSQLLTLATGIWPPAGHRDVYCYIDAASGNSKKVLATHWAMTLDDADMAWTWEVVA